MRQQARRNDGIFFAIALSELIGRPVHGHMKCRSEEGEPVWDLTTTFCYLSDKEVLSIDGIKSKEGLEVNSKGMVKLSTNSREHLLDFIDDPDVEKYIDTIVSNYKEAILDTYGQKLIGIIKT